MRQGRSRNGVGTVEPARVLRARERAVGMPMAGLLVALVVFSLVGAVGPAATGAAPPPPPLGRVVISALGPGYSVTSQGALNPSAFASDTPDPSAASHALIALGGSIATYQRTWRAEGGLNEVQDVLVRFPSSAAAQTFLQAAQRSLDSGEIVSTSPLAAVPGARVVTYFGATSQSGIGEAVTMRSERYVALLSFFSAAAANTQPITAAGAVRVARAQRTALLSVSASLAEPPTQHASSSDIGWSLLAVAVVALAVATPLFMRHRHGRNTTSPS